MILEPACTPTADPHLVFRRDCQNPVASAPPLATQRRSLAAHRTNSCCSPAHGIELRSCDPGSAENQFRVKRRPQRGFEPYSQQERKSQIPMSVKTPLQKPSVIENVTPMSGLPRLRGFFAYIRRHTPRDVGIPLYNFPLFPHLSSHPMSLSLRQSSPNPPSLGANVIRPPSTSHGTSASSLIGDGPQAPVSAYQHNPPASSNLWAPYTFGPPQSHANVMQFGDHPPVGRLGEYVTN